MTTIEKNRLKLDCFYAALASKRNRTASYKSSDETAPEPTTEQILAEAKKIAAWVLVEGK